MDRLSEIISDPKMTVSDKFAKVVDLITNTISQNIGKVVEAGASIAAALARGFLNFWNSDANPLTKILTTAVLIRLVGGKGALGATGGGIMWFQPLDEFAGVLRAPFAVGLEGGFTSYSHRDSFNQTAGTLTGKSLEIGGT